MMGKTSQSDSDDQSGWRDLQGPRSRIDAIDSKLVDLLVERLDAAAAIGDVKRRMHLGVFDPAREKEILDRLSGKARGRLSGEMIENIFRSIISAGRAVQAPLQVAYLGPEATFSHQAAMQMFGDFALFHPARNFEEVFGLVDRGACQKGIIPVENSLEGSVGAVWDLFSRYDLRICAESYFRIRLHLLSRCANQEKIKTLYSHPMPLAQSRSWRKANMPNVRCEAVESTSLAAKIAAEDPEGAALGSRLLAETSGLSILAQEVADDPGNVTRFLVLGKDAAAQTGKDKTSLFFHLDHRPGALAQMLNVLSEKNINVCRIESRPIRMRAWEYVFFADIEGHTDEPRMAGVLESMRYRCVFMKCLGSYPAGNAS